MPVTLKELAARASVHPSTVSRVANRDPKLRIAAGTRERIEALLRETEYRPNGVARGLKLRQTFVLAVVIPDVTNPFFPAPFRRVEDDALSRGYNVLLRNTDGSPERQRSHTQRPLRRRGYREEFGRWVPPDDPEFVVESGYTEAGGGKAAERLLSLPDRPTAIFAVTDMTAIGACSVARRLGLRLPEDIAIIGYNDI